MEPVTIVVAILFFLVGFFAGTTQAETRYVGVVLKDKELEKKARESTLSKEQVLELQSKAKGVVRLSHIVIPLPDAE